MTSPDATGTLFRMLADPTRRRILDLLSEHGELTVGELAAHFPELVPSGISKHLMALRAANLVTAAKVGRTQHYRLDAAAFSAALAPWLARHEPHLVAALGRLATLVTSDTAPPAPHDDGGAPRQQGDDDADRAG